jgi:hypothetical protein
MSNVNEVTFMDLVRKTGVLAYEVGSTANVLRRTAYRESVPLAAKAVDHAINAVQTFKMPMVEKHSYNAKSKSTYVPFAPMAVKVRRVAVTAAAPVAEPVKAIDQLSGLMVAMMDRMDAMEARMNSKPVAVPAAPAPVVNTAEAVA